MRRGVKNRKAERQKKRRGKRRGSEPADTLNVPQPPRFTAMICRWPLLRFIRSSIHGPLPAGGESGRWGVVEG